MGNMKSSCLGYSFGVKAHINFWLKKLKILLFSSNYILNFWWKKSLAYLEILSTSGRKDVHCIYFDNNYF